MRFARGLAVLGMLMISATTAAAAGFRLPTAGAKAMGMGFAFTAQADDPSAIYFNPAGIVQLEGTNVMAGATYVRENGGTFTGSTPLTSPPFTATVETRSETQIDLDFFIPNAYLTRKASPDFAYGIGVFVPFGLGQEYDDHHTSIFRNQITQIDLQTFVVNPTIAWKIVEALSVGAGIDFMYGKAELHKTGVVLGPPLSAVLPLATNLFDVHLEGDGTAWGYNFGILLEPLKNAKVGFNYRSPFTLKIKDGDMHLSEIHPAVAGNPAFPASSKAETTLRMPATAAFGVAYTFAEKLTIEADADWTFWHSYDRLTITNKNSPVALSSDSPKNWEDVVAFRIGGEYRVTKPLALRLGFAYDPTPVPASTMGPELPDADRVTYHAGVGYKVTNWTIDAAYYYVDKQDRTVSNQRVEGTNLVGFNGTWSGDAHLVALEVGYRF